MQNYNFPNFNDLKDFFIRNDFKRNLIICGKNSYESSGAKKIFDNILKGKNVNIFFKSNLYPDFKELKQILLMINKISPDIIIAVGGGSVIDYAKIANVLDISTNLKNEIIEKNYKIKKKTVLIALPTTAGSGAEVTPNAVLYIDKIKHSIEGDPLKPDYFFLMPNLVKSASPKIRSSAGFDAIAQALESLISKKSNEQSVEFAKRSLRISLKSYLENLNNPNSNNTLAMCEAANLSGRAISISKTTAPHAVSYPFTSIYNISHGHAVSLTLVKFLVFNFKNIKNSETDFDLKKRYEIIFELTKTKNIFEFENYLNDITTKAKLEKNFSKLGIDILKDYKNFISGVNEKRLSNNPVKLSRENLKDIITS